MKHFSVILIAGLVACTPSKELSVRWSDGDKDECVIVLHGLARGTGAMEKIAVALQHEGYQVANTGYPSRKLTIEELAEPTIEEGLLACRNADAETIHFVTHSLGGILVRYYLETESITELGRSVMLAPPNQGSEAVDAFRNWPFYGSIFGPAGQQLGTGDDSVPLKLGPVDFEVGIIAGDRSIDPIASIPLTNPDDGRVSVESTKVEGMTDFITVHHSHAFMMKRDAVIRQIVHFLNQGRFDHPADLTTNP
jgi:hypothetical protein